MERCSLLANREIQGLGVFCIRCHSKVWSAAPGTMRNRGLLHLALQGVLQLLNTYHSHYSNFTQITM